MFFVSGECSSGDFFVTDTKDFSTELWSVEDLKRICKEQGIKIYGVTTNGVSKYTVERAIMRIPDRKFSARQRKLNLAGKPYSVGVRVVSGFYAARDHDGGAMEEVGENWFLDDLENDFFTDIDLSAFPISRICQCSARHREAKASDVGSLILPDSLRSLDNYALRGCTASKIIFKAPLEEVRVGVFTNCCMTEMFLPLKGTVHLTDSLFRYCFSLKWVVLYGGTSVASTTFSCCSSLRDVHFSESFKLFTGAGQTTLDSGYKVQSGRVGQTRWFVWSEEPIRVCTQMLVFCVGDWFFSGDIELFEQANESVFVLGAGKKHDLTIHFPRGKGSREKFLLHEKALNQLSKYCNVKVVEDDWREEFGECPKKVVKGKRKW